MPIRTAFTVLAAMIAVPWTGTAAQSSYRLRFTDDDRRSVIVEAILHTRDSLLLVYPDNYDASHLPRGWSTFFRDLRAVDAAGRPVPLDSIGRDLWRIPTNASRPIRLNYEVLIHHDQGYWPVGWDEAAYARRDCDCVFFTGMAVFVGARDLTNIRVDFDLPGPRRNVQNSTAWISTTPWQPINEATNAYQVNNFHELSEVALVVGRVPTSEIHVGESIVRLSIGRGIPDGLALFEKAARDYMEALNRMIGPAPVGRFAVIANPESFTGGGAFIRSASMLFRVPPRAEDRRDWGHILAHELLHLWNGMAVQWNVTEEWWKEGATDYLSRRIQRAAGDLDDQQFLDIAATQFRYYRADSIRMSIRDAGAHKQQEGTLVYNGGFLATWLVDLSLDRETGSRASLESIMSRIYMKYRGTGRVIGLPELMSELRDAGAPLTAQLMKTLTESRQPLPVTEHLAGYGLQVTITTEGSPPIVRIQRR